MGEHPEQERSIEHRLVPSDLHAEAAPDEIVQEEIRREAPRVPRGRRYRSARERLFEQTT